MKEVISYIANDGKVFTDEIECLDYENSLKLKASGIRFLNQHDKEIPVSTDTLEDAFVIVLPTQQDIQVFAEMAEYTGTIMDGIDNPGVYVWEDGKYGGYDTWMNVQDELADARDWVNRLEKLMKIAQDGN